MTDRELAAESAREVLAGAMPGKRLERLERIAGGFGSHTFRADVAGRSFVVKKILMTSQRLLSVEQEADLIERIATIGRGPRLVAADDVKRVLVTEFVSGARSMSAVEVRSPSNLERIADCLKDMHSIDIDLPRFSPLRCAESYIAALRGDNALTTPEHAIASELRDLSVEFERDFGETHPCHNDLVAENLLLGTSLLLVDFEYAQGSTPLLDLASLAAMNELTLEQEAFLLRAYYGRAGAPCSMTEFAKVRRLVSLLTHFWARVWEGAHPIDVERYIIGRDRSGHD